MANEWHDTVKDPPPEAERLYIFIAEIDDAGLLASYRFAEGWFFMGEWREDCLFVIDDCFTVTHWMKPEVPDVFKKEIRKWTKKNT